MKLEKILIAIDFSDITPSLISFGKRLSGFFKSEIHLFHANEALMAPVSAESFGFEQVVYQDIMSQISVRLQDKVQDTVAQLNSEGFHTVGVLVNGRAHIQISDYAEQHQCGIIILGTHGYSRWEKFLLGSTTERLIRVSKVPILTIKPSSIGQEFQIKNILVPLDLSEKAISVIPTAISWAIHFKSTIHFVYVNVLSKYLDPDKDFLPEIESNYPEIKKVAYKKVILSGEKVVKSLLNYADSHSIDLFMQTSHGYGSFTSTLLGSKADELIRNAQVPVVTYRKRKSDH